MTVKRILCEKGHYYNGMMEVSCPFCRFPERLLQRTTGYYDEISKCALEYLWEVQGHQQKIIMPEVVAGAVRADEWSGGGNHKNQKILQY